MIGLVFGVLLTVGVTAGLVRAAAEIIGALFSWVESMAAGTSSADGLVLGIIIGLAAFLVLRNREERRAARKNAREAKEEKKAAEAPQPEAYYPDHSRRAGC